MPDRYQSWCGSTCRIATVWCWAQARRSSQIRPRFQAVPTASVMTKTVFWRCGGVGLPSPRLITVERSRRSEWVDEGWLRSLTMWTSLNIGSSQAHAANAFTVGYQADME